MNFFPNLFIHYILNITFISGYYLKNYYFQFVQINIFLLIFMFLKKFTCN